MSQNNQVGRFGTNLLTNTVSVYYTVNRTCCLIIAIKQQDFRFRVHMNQYSCRQHRTEFFLGKYLSIIKIFKICVNTQILIISRKDFKSHKYRMTFSFVSYFVKFPYIQCFCEKFTLPDKKIPASTA